MDEEIASELGVSEDEYLNWQSQLKVTNVVSLNEFVEQGTEPAMDATKIPILHNRKMWWQKAN